MPPPHNTTEPDRRVLTITVASAGPGRYSASLDGRELCRSRLPFFDAARVLQAEGTEGNTLLEMLWEGTDRIALRSTVGAAAGLTVVENERLGPALAPYRPFAVARVARQPHGLPPPAAGRVTRGPDVAQR